MLRNNMYFLQAEKSILENMESSETTSRKLKFFSKKTQHTKILIKKKKKIYILLLTHVLKFNEKEKNQSKYLQK